MSPRHRRSPLLLLATLALALAGCAASGGETSAAQDRPTTTGASPSTTEAADPGDDPTATTTEPDTDDDDVDVTTTEPTEPDGPDTDDIVDTNYTDVLELEVAAVAVPPTYELWPVTDTIACISPTDYADDEFCDGIEVRWGEALDTATHGNPYDPDQGDYAWYSGGDVPLCSPTYDETAQVSASTRTTVGTRDVGGEQAEYYAWELGCDNGADLEVFQWYLPEAGVLFTNRGGSIMNPIIVDHVALP